MWQPGVKSQNLWRKWVGNQQNPADVPVWSVTQGLTDQCCRTGTRTFTGPKQIKETRRALDLRVFGKILEQESLRPGMGISPPNQGRNSPKMGVFMKPCAFVDYGSGQCFCVFFWKGWHQN